MVFVHPTVARLVAATVVATTTVGCTSYRQQGALLGPSSFVGFDGKELPYKQWTTRRRNIDVVIVAVHGLSGAANDFWYLGERLSKQNIAVYAPELRGQGNDPDAGSRGDIQSAGQWSEDLRAFSRLLQKRHPGVPIVWFGESMGSLIVLRAVGDASSPAEAPDGVVLASPAVDLREGFPAWKKLILEGVSKVAPGARISLVALDPNDGDLQVTSDTTHNDQMAATPHALETVTLRLLSQVNGLMESSGRHAEELDIPALVLYTPNDPITSQEQVEGFYDRLGTQHKRSERFDQSYHLILHDVERERAASIVGDWVEGLPQ